MSCAGIEPAIVVIGYGNPLRGDDGAGWHLAERLTEAAAHPAVSVLVRHQLTPELAELLSRTKVAVFIDASCDESPGRVSQRAVVAETSGGATGSHALSPEVLLGCAKVLYGAVPEGVLFTVGGEDFGHGERLSPTVARSCAELLPRVVEFIRNERVRLRLL